MSESGGEFEVVIGLEVHAHLRTKSKLFSPAPIVYGAEPNHSVHPSLPCATRSAPGAQRARRRTRDPRVACDELQSSSAFDFRSKKLFLPGPPEGLSDFAVRRAIGYRWMGRYSGGGGREAAANKRPIHLTRIHMEEDAGKSIHDDAIAGSDATLVDLNRAGVPMIEIVSEPDLRSAEEASAYLRAVRSILRFTDVSDADMEKGHLRCDVNVSLRLRGSDEYGTRTELKNLNSFRFVEDAANAEIVRQAEVAA